MICCLRMHRGSVNTVLRKFKGVSIATYFDKHDYLTLEDTLLSKWTTTKQQEVWHAPSEGACSKL